MILNPMDLAGQRILVTGASSGIGRETAIYLSRLGAQVIVCGRESARLTQTMDSLEGTGHGAEIFDFSQLDEISAWLKSIIRDGQRLTGVVHCAGIHQATPIRYLRADALDTIMRINVSSAAMLAKAFRQKDCRAAGACSLVLISSVAGIAGAPAISAYCASKAAINGMARAMAVELAPEKIRVNAIAPGYVKTEMAERLNESLTEDQLKAITVKHPLGIGEPADVAAAAAFLLSDAARWITGSTIVVDGGFTAH